MEFGKVSESARRRVLAETGRDIKSAKEVLLASKVLHQAKDHPAWPLRIGTPCRA